MALSRKKWNTIIILASAMMIAVLTFLDSKTTQLPADVMPLFDSELPLKQLQINAQSFVNNQGLWQCSDNVLNCKQWVAAWKSIAISALKK